MAEGIVGAAAPVVRTEDQTGSGSRRRWSAEEKRRIVAESLAPGAIVSALAKRHGISASRLFAWRKAARDGDYPVLAEEELQFVPVLSSSRDARTSDDGCVTIEIAGAVVRPQRGIDLGWLTDVLRAVRAAE